MNDAETYVVKEFRSSIAFRVAAGVALVLFAAAAATLYLLKGWTLLTVGSIFMFAFAVGGFADALTMRVILRDESILIVKNLIRREYPRLVFLKAEWAKGSGVALQRRTGEWLRLPSVGGSPQGMTNSLRAWINR